MTKVKGRIKLLQEPYNMIKWFTKDENFDHEVGALGIGEVKNGELVISKLVFPDQIVNGVHVHFEPKDWAVVLKQLTDEEIGKVCFYWHKHPGSASASEGDEEDTFDVFMDDTAGREIFGFLQTADDDGTMEYEARIEIRHPVRATITEVTLTSTENDKIGKKCEKIIKDHITIGNSSAGNQPGVNGNITTYNGYGQIIKAGQNIDGMCYLGQNDKEPEVIYAVDRKNGSVIVTVSNYVFNEVLDYLESDDIKKMWKSFTTDINDPELSHIKIQPKKKCIKRLTTILDNLQDDIQAIGWEKGIDSDLMGDKYDEAKDIRDSTRKNYKGAHGLMPPRDSGSIYDWSSEF